MHKELFTGRPPQADGEDELIAPGDASDDTLPPSSRASSPASRASSRLSNYALTSASEAESSLPGPSGHTERPKLSKKSSSKRGGGSNIFLTAAEQRQQAQKDEKTGDEGRFDFLLDVRDKDGVRPREPGYDPRTLYIPPQAWRTFRPFEKQVRCAPTYYAVPCALH